jgi:hypothetical protein
MVEQLLELMFQCDRRSIGELRKLGVESCDKAVVVALTFLRRSAENGRHIWGGFRESVVHTLIDLIGQANAEQRLLREWAHFPEEARLDFVYDVLGDANLLSSQFGEYLFFHHASSMQCKSSILDKLLRTRDQRHLDRSFFFRLLDTLAAQATPATRDDIDVFCIQMYELIWGHYGLPN